MSKPGERRESTTLLAPPGTVAGSPAITKPNEPGIGEPVVIYSPEQNAAPTPVQFDKKTYDKYLFPASRDIAAIHGRANMAGNLMSLFNIKDARLPRIYQVHYNNETFDPSKLAECPCCNKFDSGKKVWLSINNIALAPLGAAVPGFFDFAKFCITSMLTIGMLYSIYMMIIYGSGSECKYNLIDRGCGDPWKFFLSAANYRRGGVDIIERTLMLISFLALYILKVVYFAWFRKLNAQSNAFVQDITDYSVELRGLPKNVTNQDIENFFHEQKKNFKNSKGKAIDPLVRTINYVFSGTDELKKMTDSINKNIKEYKKMAKEKKDLVQLEKKKTELVKEVEDAEKLLKTEYTVPKSFDPKTHKTRKELSRFTGSAYVSFDNTEQADCVRDNMMVASVAKIFYKLFRALRGPFARLPGANRYTLSHNPGYFYIEKAEKPEEIVFEHLGLSVLNRSFRKIFSFLFSVIVIGGTFALILYLKGQENTSDTSQTGKLIVVGIGILIKILGIVLSFITTLLIEFEKPETTTERNIGTIWRSTISVFINSVLVLIVVNVVFKKDKLDESMFTNTGVYNDLLFQLILAVIEAAASFAEPSIPLGFLKAWWDRRQGDKSTNPQYEVNTYYEGAVFNFPRRFGKYLTLMMITFFLIRVFPYAPFIAAVIAVLFYWSDKFFLLRFAKIPEYNTNELPLSMLRFMDMIFVTWTVGYILFDLIAYDTIYPWSWAMFAIAMFSLVMNANYALRKTFVFDLEEESDKQIDLMTFIKVIKGTVYSISNPVDVLKVTIKNWKDSEAQKLKEQKRLEKLQKDNEEKQKKLNKEKELEEAKRKLNDLKTKKEAQKNVGGGVSAAGIDVADVKLRQNSFEQREMEAEEARLREEEERLERELEEQEEQENQQSEESEESEDEGDEDSDEFGKAVREQIREDEEAQQSNDNSESEKKSALNEVEMFGMPMDALQEDDERYAPPEDLEVRLRNLEVKEEPKAEPSVASENKKVEGESKGLADPAEP